MSWINSNTTYKQNSKNDLSFYHGFSKTPVEPTSSGTAATTLANASTKGGHTVIGTEVWAEEIPWFGLVASRTAAVERLSGLTKLNDLVKIDGEGGKVYKYIGDNDATFTEAQWSSFWREVTLTNGMTLNNRHDQPVLRYYLNQPMQTLTTTNNASIDSKGYATRLFVNESDHTGQTSGGSVISQFAAGTDNIKNGIPSVELNPKLYLGTTEKIAGTHYYDYNVSGTILWNANVASSSPKISCFRYIGKTVTDAVGTLNGDDATDGSVAKIVKDAIDALGDIAVKSDITITDIKVQNGNEQAVSLTPDKDKSVTITIPEVQNATTTKAGIVIISDNNAIETSESASTTTATVGAVAATRSAIENQISSHTSNNNIHITASERSSWNTAATKAGTAVQTVKRSDDSSTLISVNQSENNVSIGLSNTVATKTDITNLENKITEEVDSLLKTKADEKLLENTIGKVSEITKNLQDVESNLLKHTSNADEGVLHVTQAEKDIWNAGGNALQEITEGDHIEVDGNTVGVNTTSLVADTIFTTKVNELIEEGLSTVEESIDDINNELETYNYSIAQSIETGTVSGTNNTRGFGTLITNDITLGKVITYCHSTGGAENSNIWLKVFEKSSPHIFKGISDASLNHKHGATLEYTFKNSDIKLEANKEYFFVFCPENQKNSTTFQNSTDSVDCCIQTVTNTTGYGGVCGPTGISNDDYIALHKIYKKPGKFAFTADLEEETTRATQREEELENLIKNKVEALPSVYTGDNMFYTNCYGFEYTNPSENIIFDKIEIKFAKNLDTLTKYKPQNAPEISPLEIENDICKIVVAKVKTPPPGVYEQPPASDEIEIATSSYNTNISKEVNLSQFKFSENIILEGGWNYRFYFYDKNGSLFPASVIINYVPVGDTTLKQSSVANRYLSDRYDYWGVHGPEQDNNTKVLNGLGLKLINSVQEHINDESIHFSQKEYIIVDENGNPVEITFSDRITNGTQMFSSWAMDTFIHSLPQLKNGYQMFRNCKNLTTFLGELPLLEDGTQMFFSCKLNALSAITIIDSLKNNLAPAEKSYSIHLGISEETKTDENLLLALEESGNEVNSSYNITNKNGATWTINFIINA